ncbi:nickel pincer cofactor biosynthesis protein LarC [Thermodesulfobacteriota bacterium]
MIAYFDCFSGISGDMTLGAFVSLGVPIEWLEKQLHSIPLPEIELTTEPISRHGISANQVNVHAKSSAKARDYNSIATLIKNSPLHSTVKAKSLDIFDRLATAEAHIHGRPKGKVHFHEVGGLDAIADVVGTALCIEYLKIDQVIASAIPLGKGFVECSHGTLPVPAPATLAILKDIPVYGARINQEIVTPTGAAIIASLAESFGEIPNMMVEAIGYGAGKREIEDRPNLLRVLIGKSARISGDSHLAGHTETIGVVETCVDDMNPEHIGFMMDRLYEDGALEVYLLPVFTKKNRPGTMIQVLCRLENKNVVLQRILSETTSLGARYYNTQRLTLVREGITIKSPFGKIQAKRVTDLSGAARIVPEYEVCRKIALEKNIPIKDVYTSIFRESKVQS